ncbi:MAG: CocE/NonD family hydrolase [Armatimonadetes bacterium]|nr:CocE/NonD family hydrolase [Armatimonadota bacterium]
MSTPSYDALIESNVMVPLRDGVRLATDLYFPAEDGRKVAGRFPVVLMRTPYDKTGSAATGQYYAERGYVAAVQDVRGRYASEGIFYPFAHEGPDGYDAVEWLAAQPWCDGKVGTCGASYVAAVQNALASLNPPHLAAMIVTFGPSSYFHSSMRHNGALELRFVSYAFSMAARSKEAMADPDLKAALDDAYRNVWEWLRSASIRPGTSPLSLIPSYEQWCIDILTRVRYDEYWQQPGYGPLPYYDRHADVPTLYVGGWYDSYTRSTVENFMALSRRQKTPVHLLMGPWTHGGVGRAVAGIASFLPEGGLSDYEGLRMQWFDQFLKGIPSGIDRRPPVRYFVMGGGAGLQPGSQTVAHGGTWKSAATWPPPGITPTPFYFHADGTLSTQPPEEKSEPTRYTFDPAHPVPTVGGNLSAIDTPAGAFDQRCGRQFPGSSGTMPLSSRQDVLCFATPPLREDVVIVGPLRVKLWVATDGPDTDFTAKLIDVYPPGPNHPAGCALNLSDSIARLRFREGFTEEKLAQPGEVYELEFEMYPTANRFVKGHRIRVDISSSNWPRFDVNPNTGGPLGRERRMRVAENSLYHDPARPSHIVLPLAAG